MARDAVHAVQGQPERASTPWHSYDWDAVLAGQGSADRYYLRAGLVRKDRLALLAPARCHPETAVVKTFAELISALEKMCDVELPVPASEGECEDDVCFVLKKARSSNADGIRFLTRRDAKAAISLARTHSSQDLISDNCLSIAALLTPILYFTIALVAVKNQLFKDAWRKTACVTQHARLAGLLLGTGFTSLVLLDFSFGPKVFNFTALTVFRGAAITTAAGQADALALDLRCQFGGAEAASAGGAKGGEPWVLQRHVKPWLHEGRKFHLRALLLCIGDLQAWMHEDVRMLLATEPFVSGCRDAGNASALITNMGASSRHSAYDEATQNLSLDALGEECSQAVLQNAIEVLGATLVKVKACGRRHFFTTPNCWELFGVDLLVEHNTCRVYLLEINPSPSLAMYGGPGVRPALVGKDPLSVELPLGWLPVPLEDGCKTDGKTS